MCAFACGLYLLSRNVRVGAGGRPSLWLAVGRDVQEVPDQNGVVVRTADDLKLIELKTEHAARVLLQTHSTSANHVYVLSEVFDVNIAAETLEGKICLCWTKLTVRDS